MVGAVGVSCFSNIDNVVGKSNIDSLFHLRGGGTYTKSINTRG